VTEAFRLDDPAFVREQYASERGLEARRSIYRSAEGVDPRELVFTTVAESAPGDVLEVGCGPGEASERIGGELGARVVAVDLSPRMVELARARGVDARVGDVQELPFSDESFDCALAAWVLFHVADLERALSELARVLRSGGRLVAATNGEDHLAELWTRVGAEPWVLPFRSENAEEALRRHFSRVERREARGRVMLSADDVRTYLDSSPRGRPYVDAVAEPFEPLAARTHSTVFVAAK
jgi:ubiquinone/menaquinone biosynthesis C-methylase UbiE